MFYTAGWVHVICGCMFCGKTDEMLRLLRRFSIAGRRVVLVKPRLDTRTEESTVISRSGAQHVAVPVDDSRQIEALVGDADIVAIEEGQFFDERLPWPGRLVLRQERGQASAHAIDIGVVSAQAISIAHDHVGGT
ncbi:MAG: hypothetical protein M3P32_03570, partial [Chloroflexota bacterium]|nr:hypothetical protein [Chloroflexota bacterium]